MLHADVRAFPLVGLVFLCWAGAATPTLAQTPPTPSPILDNRTGTLLEKPYRPGQARMHYLAGLRQTRKAERLIAEASQETDPKERDELEAKARMTYEAAVEEFAQATKLSPRWLDPYVPLGAALRVLERHQEALQVHVAALEVDPSSDENFLGWVDSILQLDLLGDATAAHETLVEIYPERAEMLRTALERWLEDHRADPAGIDPAHIDRLAAWIDARDAKP